MPTATTYVDTLSAGWRLYRTAADAVAGPAELDRESGWKKVTVPGTVAATVFGDSDLSCPPFDVDAFDWWYEIEFEARAESALSHVLDFSGLATLADVWLNDRPILSARNMFRRYRVDVSGTVAKRNRLTIVFRSVDAALRVRRPRPRWKTNLVSHQQLRWLRTTLLGRIPGWTPRIPPVGPWRSVTLETAEKYALESARVHAGVDRDRARIVVDVAMRCNDTKNLPQSAQLSIGGEGYDLDLDVRDGIAAIRGEVFPNRPAPWWPHTHGEPALHACDISVTDADASVSVWQGTLGFRTVEVDRDDDLVALRINGQPIFARGGCWTCNDIVSIDGNPDALRRKLERLKSAGTNMIRVGGTMVYESDAFHAICDELGILVWQDFMFANMDYPADDPEFANEVRREVDEQVRRLLAHPSTAVFCGGSETEQQPAMYGMTEDVWTNTLFHETLPQLAAECGSDLPWFPSSPCEGALPFHNASGIAHYFGVGAYQRPLTDLDRAAVRFAGECLAFANVPGDRALRRHFGTTAPAVHTPDWKRGVPRDASAGWDFEDVRDHYVRELYRLDPVALRYSDNARYIAISQVVTGEIMAHTFNHWRDAQDPCNGALIWWLNDILPGAGWGMLDSDGDPKPLWYFLRRCWSDRTLSIVDNGLDGLEARVINESAEIAAGSLRVQIVGTTGQVIADESTHIEAAPLTTNRVSLDRVLGRFYDTTWAYRFGPPKHDVVVVTLDQGDARNPLTAACYPQSRNLPMIPDDGLTVDTTDEDGNVSVRLRSPRFLHGVKLHSTTHEFGDNYFDLPPDTEVTVTATPLASPAKPLRATLSALNLDHPKPFS